MTATVVAQKKTAGEREARFVADVDESKNSHSKRSNQSALCITSPALSKHTATSYLVRACRARRLIAFACNRVSYPLTEVARVLRAREIVEYFTVEANKVAVKSSTAQKRAIGWPAPNSKF